MYYPVNLKTIPAITLNNPEQAKNFFETEIAFIDANYIDSTKSQHAQENWVNSLRTRLEQSLRALESERDAEFQVDYQLTSKHPAIVTYLPRIHARDQRVKFAEATAFDRTDHLNNESLWEIRTYYLIWKVGLMPPPNEKVLNERYSSFESRVDDLISQGAGEIHEIVTQRNEHNELYQDLLGKVEKARSDHKEWHAQSKADFDAFMHECKAEYEKTLKQFKDEIPLHQAAMKLKERAQRQFWTGVGLAVLWGALGSVGLVLLYNWSDLDALNVQTNAGPLVKVFLMATVVIWFLRVLARLIVSRFHLSQDNRNKATLVETLLGLREDETLKPENVSQIINLLFNLPDTGILKGGDGQPVLGAGSLLSRGITDDRR